MRFKLIKNPDQEFVKNLKRRIKDNGGYCPCRPSKIPENKCPCSAYREDGECICGLFIRVPVYDDEEGAE